MGTCPALADDAVAEECDYRLWPRAKTATADAAASANLSHSVMPASLLLTFPLRCEVTDRTSG